MLRVIMAMNFVSTKLMIHSYNYQVFLGCIVSIPILMVILRQIPKRYVVFSQDVIH